MVGEVATVVFTSGREVSVGPALGVAVDGGCEPLQKFFILLEQLLILINAVEDTLLVTVALS